MTSSLRLVSALVASALVAGGYSYLRQEYVSTCYSSYALLPPGYVSAVGLSFAAVVIGLVWLVALCLVEPEVPA